MDGQAEPADEILYIFNGLSDILEFEQREIGVIDRPKEPSLPACLKDAEHTWAEEGEQFKTNVVVQLPQVGAGIPKHCSCREVPTLRTTWLEQLGPVFSTREL